MGFPTVSLSEMDLKMRSEVLKGLLITGGDDSYLLNELLQSKK